MELLIHAHDGAMSNTPPVTLLQLAGATTHRPDSSTSALIVIDAQQEYGPHGLLGLNGVEAALTNIERLESIYRSNGRPVVHVAHTGRAGAPFDPARGGKFFDLTGPVFGEPTVSKTLPNSFAGTDLHELLKNNGVVNLVLVGFMTHMCVSSTARAALDLGYPNTVIRDATATRDLPTTHGTDIVSAAALHEASLAALADRFSAVMTTADFARTTGATQVANQPTDT